jgi:hypothetical protein
MLLVDHVRKMAKEAILFQDDTDYSISNVADWTTVASKNISLSEECVVYIYGLFVICDAKGAGRILVDGNPIVSTGGKAAAGTPVQQPRECFIVLGAGSHTISYQLSMWYKGTTSPSIKWDYTYAATFDFADRYNYSKYVQGLAVSNNTSVYVINNETLASSLPARRTPAGKIKKYVVLIFGYFSTSGYRLNTVLNSGDPNVMYTMNWRLYINGAAVSFYDKLNDFADGDSSNQSYGAGSYGYYVGVVDAGTSPTISVSVYNYNTGATRTAVLSISAIICPWIIPTSEYEPITLEFPQGSTIYVLLEPFLSDPTKTLKIGSRVLLGSASTSSYYTASGTGIVTASYTFEIVGVSGCVMTVSGYGGCITAVGVDIR